MKTKKLTIAIITLVLGIFIFGAAGSAYAQTSTPETEETLPAPEVTRQAFGHGNCDGTCDADGDGIRDRLQLRDGSGLGNQSGYGFGPGDGTCDADGDGVPDQLRLRDASGSGMQHGMGMGQNFGSGSGTGMQGNGQGYGAGAGMGTGRSNGGSGLGMGPGQGMGDGQGFHDGSCMDD